MKIRIHPAENREDYIQLALDLFMEAAADDLLKDKEAAEQRKSA